MSKRIRTIKYIEGKIIRELSKRQITTYFGLSACVLRNVRSIEEQHNLDIALTNLFSKKEITKQKDQNGFSVYKLVA